MSIIVSEQLSYTSNMTVLERSSNDKEVMKVEHSRRNEEAPVIAST